MYEEELAAIYDLVYEGRGKDHAAEAEQVLGLVRARAGEPASLLDVACGTGAHLRHFAAAVPDAEGLELSEDMLGVARGRMPGVKLHRGDMRAFSLGRRFSAAVCMFSSIGYMRDAGELGAALRCFAEHLEPGGVCVIEPWWFPETFIEGYVGADTVQDGGRTVTRMSHSVRAREGRATHMEVHFLVADAGSGIRHFSNAHEITLFRRGEYEAAFTGAGLDVEYLDGGPSGRGLFVGVRT
ncbi:class I SAM-dependent methyltransferase [Nocardiopsis composta]|uniref:SAM-dependent methyltransferase n=1 Tax=Nocardiopsis composta TaxID=157465 RepID=A0A7W8VCZ9_9ACTN|nr:class I SAM-dependent methyltransferase [Nocardiopsis composta]MBB5431483.1 SAM-dependent methyltransferase [Nocardiopsis composta]